MLRNFLIFSLCFVAIRASGEFSVLSSPPSLSFKGNDPLQSDYVGDVLSAAMGRSVAGDAQWDGVTVNDPFALGKGVVALYVDGVNQLSLNSNAKTYELYGGNVGESLNAASAELEASNVPVCDIDFAQYDEAISAYRSCFGDVNEPTVTETKNLKPAKNTADKEFLASVGYLEAVSKNLANMKKASNFLVIRLSLQSIVKAHGEKSAAVIEATELVASAVTKLNAAAQKSSNKEALVVVIANKSYGSRSKRDLIAGNSSNNTYNLAEFYNEDYPVIFNIILWFMVVFGLSLLAICYAIGSMDPGRDSIIYRMTSTRMKKDN